MSAKFLVVLLACALTTSCTQNTTANRLRAAESSRAWALVADTILAPEPFGELVKNANIKKAPLSAENATRLAHEARLRFFGVFTDYARGPGYALGLPARFEREVAALLQSKTEDRAAIDRFLLKPFEQTSLDYFAQQHDFEGLVRLGILAHPVAPQRAIYAYERSRQVKRDPFVTAQLLELYIWNGNRQLARLLIARGQNGADEALRGVMVKAEAHLDANDGVFQTWTSKLGEALALFRKADDREYVAATLAELSTFDGPGNFDQKYAESALKRLEEAQSIATALHADVLLMDIAELQAQASEFGRSSKDHAVVDSYIDQAEQAAIRSGKYFHLGQLAYNAGEAAVANGDNSRLSGQVKLMELTARQTGDLTWLFAAQRLRIKSATKRGNFEQAEAIGKAWQTYVQFAGAQELVALRMLQVDAAYSTDHLKEACVYQRQVQALFRSMKSFENIDRANTAASEICHPSGSAS